VNDKKTEVGDEINYLGVIFESSGGSERQKLNPTAKGNQTSVAIGKCLARTCDIRVKISENVYETRSEFRTMYGIEMWVIDGGWKEIDKIHSRFRKTILGVPRFAANNVTELQLGRDSMRGKAEHDCETLVTIITHELPGNSRNVL
jgi:hypothetical protein